jgi:OPA family sugar phosphate sensor protein UhpC-like MFS transporter
MAAYADPAVRTQYTVWRWRVFIATWLAYFGLYLTRRSFSAAKVVLLDHKTHGIHWDKPQLALIGSVNLTTYAIGNFAAGALGDRFGTRAVVLSGLLGSIVIALATGSVSAVGIFAVLMALQGFCQASGWAPLAKNIGEFFSRKERGGIIGWWCTSYAVGGFVGAALAGWAADTYGWRAAFWIPAGALTGVLVLFFLLQRNRPEDVGLPSPEAYRGEPEDLIVADEGKPEEEGGWEVVKLVLRNKMVILLCVVYFLLKGTRYFVIEWSPVYVSEMLKLNAARSSTIGSMFDIASIVAVVAGGYISDRLLGSRRMPLSVFGLIGTAALMYFFTSLPHTESALIAGFLGVGVMLGFPDSLVSGTAAVDFGTKRAASTAAGFVNGAGGIGAVIGASMPGWMGLEANGKSNWHPMFVALAIALIVAAVMLLPQWNAVPPSTKTVATDDATKAVVGGASSASTRV